MSKGYVRDKRYKRRDISQPAGTEPAGGRALSRAANARPARVWSSAGVDDPLPTPAVRSVLVRQHEPRTPPGLLAEWLEGRGIPFEVSHSWKGEKVEDLTRYSFVASLGAPYGPNDTHEPLVVAELGLIGAAVAKGVPVLGLCFGGEVLSVVLGGSVERAPKPELGWREIETDEPGEIPAGPWLEWHFERFTTPPGAVELARTKDAAQAFRYGPHLGVQFHPESTAEIVSYWASKEAELSEALGFGDGSTLLATPPEQEEAARVAAFKLFDAFLARVSKDDAGEAAEASKEA